VRTQASSGDGVEELADRIAEHRAHIIEEGTLEERRRRNLRNEVMELATVRLRRRLEASVRGDEELQTLLDEVVARRLDPASAATRLLEELRD
jgi:LAO/AO transport system kinase